MEDVLDLYAQTPDPQIARLCFDERPCQILGDVLLPVPMQPGHARKQDDEYKIDCTGQYLHNKGGGNLLKHGVLRCARK